MNKVKRFKILSIVALVIAIVGMSLGFAAFSATLNISSSASVKPNADDFKVMIYGMSDPEKNPFSVSSYDNEVFSLPDDFNYENKAYITNSKTSSTIDIGMFSSTSFNTSFYFLIMNEGKYTVYDYDDSIDAIRYGVEKVCDVIDVIADPEAFCNSVSLTGQFYDMNGDKIYEILLEPGEYLFLQLNYNVEGLPDGDVGITFRPIEFNFKTHS